MKGKTQLAVKLMYGCGLRMSETTRLRVQDIDYKVKTIKVRSGKGAKGGQRIPGRLSENEIVFPRSSLRP